MSAGRSAAKVTIGLGGLIFASFIVTILIAVAIWPGEAKLTAPLLCPDDQPDAFVVTDTYSDGTGETSTNFTLYCVGPDGESTDQGFAIPLLILATGHTAILFVLLVALGARSAVKARRRHPELASQDALQAELDVLEGVGGVGVAGVVGQPSEPAPAPPLPPNPIEGTIPPGPIIS